MNASGVYRAKICSETLGSVFIIIDPEECLKEEKCLSMSYIAGNYLGILKID